MTHSIAARLAAVLLVPVLAVVMALSLGATQAQAIVGGRDATTTQYPWMVFLSRVGDPTTPSGQFCGGALVAPTKVVTAAHCIDDLTPEQFQVIGGRTDLHGQRGTVRDVVTVWNAPRVPPPAADLGDPPFMGGGDLAVLTLDEPMPYRTLRMVDGDDGWRYTPGRPATILGWGIYQEEGLPGPSPGVFGPILSRNGTVCQDAYSGFTRVDVYADLIRAELRR
ncbi:trypsin-like serine protease [Promicromonospora sp. AC04]|uniref:S1 family peptidase n=1 Tax=Promicromonospora sp. AC04 TaxID=2135723 RepID=UPI001304F1FF|nr:trypsin-like serine protease [Promicromonospora sp. AC04]